MQYFVSQGIYKIYTINNRIVLYEKKYLRPTVHSPYRVCYFL